MGLVVEARIGVVQGYSSAERTITADLGGGETADLDVFFGPGIDAPPLDGDQVAAVEHTESGELAAVGADPGPNLTAERGEFRLFSRDPQGVVVASAHLQGDGTIVVQTAEGAKITVTSDGITLEGTAVTVQGDLTVTGTLEAAGITDSSVSLGVSLGTHVHTSAAPGSPTSTPTPGT